MSRMKYISVCSGIEAATVAWHHLGWEPAWFSEIEPFPCSVLKHHYPNVPNLGDMTKWSEWPDETIDVLVGGTPCQSFSVAGKRGGMDDHRGQLALSFSAIAKCYKPRWIVWENVPGVLSSGGGRDFGAFLGSLAELGYGCAYRVLDAQHFGVAQRRRRVFVVGHLGDWRRAAAVLFERKGLCRDSAKGGKARKGIARTIAPSLVSSGRGVERIGESRGQDPVVVCMAHGQGGAEIRENSSPTLTCNHEAPIIAGVQRSTPAWVECPEECGDYWCNIHEQHTGDCDCPPIDEWVTDPYGMQIEGPAANQPIVLMDQGGSVMNTLTDGTVGTLRREMHGHEPCVLAFAQNQLGEVRAGEVFNTINTNSNASGRNTPMVAFPANMSATQRASAEGVACNLQARNPTAVAISAETFGLTTEQTPKFASNLALTLTKQSPTGGGQPQAVVSALQVRRLTPIECERLQGFPDNYTNVPHRGKPAADGPRYKALGNSMAVPCMRWIGERIRMVEAIKESEGGEMWNL